MTAVQGGPAMPVYIMNDEVPTTPGGGGATPTALSSGTQAVSTSAGRLNSGTSLACTGVLVTNDANSANNILVGDSSSQVYPLEPGDSVAIAIDNVNKVYVRTASGAATVNWIRTG